MALSAARRTVNRGVWGVVATDTFTVDRTLGVGLRGHGMVAGPVGSPLADRQVAAGAVPVPLPVRARRREQGQVSTRPTWKGHSRACPWL